MNHFFIHISQHQTKNKHIYSLKGHVDDDDASKLPKLTNAFSLTVVVVVRWPYYRLFCVLMLYTSLSSVWARSSVQEDCSPNISSRESACKLLRTSIRFVEFFIEVEEMVLLVNPAIMNRRGWISNCLVCKLPLECWVQAETWGHRNGEELV